MYKDYSNDIWDYLIYMPYMPSRSDRDALLGIEDKKRVKIWDYFFRIKPEDVGAPQQQEIKSIQEWVEAEINRHNQEIEGINLLINDLKRATGKEKLRRLIYGSGSLLLGFFLLNYVTSNLYLEKTLVFLCLSPIILYSLITLTGIAVLHINEGLRLREFKKQTRDLRDSHKEKVDVARKRIRNLRLHIKELQGQIPAPPSSLEVRQWLNEDFAKLWEKTKDATGLGNRLLTIRGLENPIPVLGPGELQHSERIPPQYTTQISLDKNKHLTARRAFYVGEYIEVLYGVYYLEYILIADDMLATRGLFYDFITATESSEQTTEQYYKDVVAIATTKEFRRISIDSEDQATIYIDDAPTFTLSLADGEKRTVTFVNEKYFMGIKEKINISEDKISKIYWIRDSEKIADNAIKALRHRLRIHKGTSEDDADSQA